MKHLRLPLLLILALGLAALAQAGVTTYTYYFTAPQVQVIDGQTTVTMEGTNTWARVGAPWLPMAPVELLLPPGEEAVSITAETASPVLVGQGYRIPHRNQPYPYSLGSAAKPTPADQSIYTSDVPYPAQAAGDLQTQFYAGHSIGYAALHPVTYRPVAGELSWVPWIRVTVTSRPSSQAQESFGSLLLVDSKTNVRLSQLVQNPQEIPIYGFEQPARPAGWDMLLITPQAFEAFYQSFAQAKTRAGIMTKIVTVEYIYANYTGADNQTKIRNCVIDYYHNQGVKYVFLGGDNEHIPHRGLFCAAGYTDNDIAADLYYAALDGNWNADGDANWGEPGEEDYIAEVYIGRSCGDTQSEIEHFLNKTTMYENTPVGNQLETGLMAGEDLGWPIWAWSYKEEIRLGSSNWGYQTWGFPANFVVDTLYERPGYSWTAMGNLLPKLNQGPNLVNHLGHGSTNLVMQFSTGNITDVNFTNNGVNRNFFIAYSQACYSGSFDNRGTSGPPTATDCICEEFTTIAHAAVAWECNSRYGWGDLSTTNGPSQHFDRHFFDALFHENLTTLGMMNGDSKEDNIWLIPSDNTIRWCYYELNLLGDPTLDVWTDTPMTFNPIYNPVVLLGSSTFQVTGVAPGALVTMSLNNVVLGQGVANGAGLALVTFDAPLVQLGVMTIMATLHNYLPYQGTVQIIPPSGPYVVYSSSVVNDTLTGNGNGLLDYSETANLTMTVQNVGVSQANSVSLKIRSTDAFVTILDSTATVGNIPANGYATALNGFQIRATSAVPDQHALNFTLLAASGDSTWSSYFVVVAHAPNAQYGSHVVNDPPPGNQNGNLDPGETATFVIIARNEGTTTVNNLTMSLMPSSDPYISIPYNLLQLGTVAPGGTASGSVPVVASPSCPQEHVVVLTLHFEGANGYTSNDTFSITIGDVMYAPTGPDLYGYFAYDNYDGVNAFTYNWVEIAPGAGGPGTLVNALMGRDDASSVVTLPFTFRYYGQDFTQVTICTNGWLAMGSVPNDSDWSESAIPNADGPPNMLAPFWEDMNMETGGQVATYYDAAGHRCIVEFYRVPQWTPSSALETFEVIFFDPAFHSTPTGDGKIVFQYYRVSDPSSNTVGIENGAETTGLQYLFDGAYDIHAAPLDSGRTICFLAGSQSGSLNVVMTPINPPIVVPANGGQFQFNATAQRTQAPQTAFWVWARDRYPDGTYTGNLLGPVNINPPVGVTVTRQRTQVVPSSWPAGVHYYIGYANPTVSYPAADADSFSWTKSTTTDGGPEVTSCENFGESFAPYEVVPEKVVQLPTRYGLDQNRPNPFNPVTAISYQLPLSSQVRLQVFDVSGRLVTTLVNGLQEAGYHQVTFDGSELSSGLYFIRMQAGSFNAVKKMMLVK